MGEGRQAANIFVPDLARFVLAVLLMVGTLGLLLLQRDVPTVLWAMDASALGFYFGGLVATVRS